MCFLNYLVTLYRNRLEKNKRYIEREVPYFGSSSESNSAISAQGYLPGEEPRAVHFNSNPVMLPSWLETDPMPPINVVDAVDDLDNDCITVCERVTQNANVLSSILDILLLDSGGSPLSTPWITHELDSTPVYEKD